ncbi:MAG: cytochrome c [Syntrophotaleaceae bacterium]
MLSGLDRRHSRQWLILAAALLWPLSQVLELLLVPELARSGGVYLAAALALLAAMGLALMLLEALRRKQVLPLARPLAAIIVLALFWVLGAQAARENSLTGLALAGLKLPPLAGQQGVAPASPSSPRPAAEAQPPMDIDSAQLFKQKCGVCHRFDQRLVGPPLDTVLGKYRPDRGALAGFLRNPQKIDPAYPPMPNLNLTEQEAAALADYLLDREAAQPAP